MLFLYAICDCLFRTSNARFAVRVYRHGNYMKGIVGSSFSDVHFKLGLLSNFRSVSVATFLVPIFLIRCNIFWSWASNTRNIGHVGRWALCQWWLLAFQQKLAIINYSCTSGCCGENRPSWCRAVVVWKLRRIAQNHPPWRNVPVLTNKTSSWWCLGHC